MAGYFERLGSIQEHFYVDCYGNITYETDSFIFMHFIDNKNEPDKIDENFE
jgi:hypothetical protein